MADKATTEAAVETEVSVTDADLKKSIEELQALLDTDSADETVEKAVIGTGGGLQAETPSDGEINADIVDEDKEDEQDPLEAEAEEQSGIPITKGLEDGEELEADPLFEEFQKALAGAFTEQEPLVEAAKNDEFSKSLVLSTIEGFSIANEEMHKALAGLEERQEQKLASQMAQIESITKALTAVSNAVAAVMKEVSGVANAPVRTAPKASGYITKSFSGAETQAQNLSKAQIAEVMEKRVIAGKLDVHALARFESTGEIDPALLAEIQSGSAR